MIKEITKALKTLIDSTNMGKLKPAIAKIKTGRNDPCPCGSGRKFKRCCINR